MDNTKITRLLSAGTAVALLLSIILISPPIPGYARQSGRDLQFKLSQKTKFSPQSTSALDQLIEIAQHYQIPMGIEWMEQRVGKTVSLKAESSTTVKDIIDQILHQYPKYQMTIENEVLHVAPMSFASSPNNFLNLRIEEFEVKNQNLYQAEAKLRLSVRMTLHPERYTEGFNGGFGYPPDGIFSSPAITISGYNLTVREILDRIATGNGNALWVVKIEREDTINGTSSQVNSNEGGNTSDTFRWEFIPIRLRGTFIALGDASDEDKRYVRCY